MAIKVQSKKQKSKKSFYKFIVVAFALLAVTFIFNIAPNYLKDAKINQVNLVINQNNVTARLKNRILIQDKVIYLSTQDIATYFDNDLYFDSTYQHFVTTSDTKVAVIPINAKRMTVNGANVDVYYAPLKEGDIYYLPFSEISEIVYNVEVKYVESSNTVIATSLDRELVYANSLKNNSVKYKPTNFSKTMDKIQQGDSLIIIKNSDSTKGEKNETDDNSDQWTKVATERGKIGYVKTNSLSEVKKLRENFVIEKQIEGNISLIWDYFSEFKKAPQRTEKIEGVNVVSPAFVYLKKQGQGEIVTNIGTEGLSYIRWAHNNGYRVWTLVSNNSLKETTSEVLNDYQFRTKFINSLIDVVVQYNIDGVNLDFENVFMKDKDAYTKLVQELAPRLRELGKVLSVDVTAPDGTEDWSLCFDRKKIAEAADYIVFMAYDQYGTSSTKAGTTAGYNWVENNLKKFLDPNREGIDSQKLILAVPFYTRLWKIDGEKLTSETISMKNIVKNIPSGVTIKWDETLHQNYAEYTQNGATYKIWIEDLKSMTDRLKLFKEYQLGGVAFWRKDMEDDDVWKLVQNLVFTR